MLTIRVLRDAYRDVTERIGPDGPSLEVTFERGARSYLEHPRVTKLMMEGTLEERLDELQLNLAQTKASYGILETWRATEEKDYAAGREAYTALANEFERMNEGPVPRLREDIKVLSREVTVLEVRLRAAGGEPEEVEPPFPKTVTRPTLVSSEPAAERSIFRRLWEKLQRSMAGPTE